jgi:GT2 family glycosyltransferase
MSRAIEAVDVVVVNWNGRRFLPRCLEALSRSTVAVKVIVVDNTSTDGSVEYLRAEHPEVEMIALPENVGYAGGANVGIQATSGDYVMVMNPDVILDPAHLEVLRARLEAEPAVGAAQGKLLQIRPEDYLTGRPGAATRLDSAGHAIRRTRMVVDIGQGEPDGGRFDKDRSVFSACGAALFLRRAMLEDLSPDGEYFDEAFFAYKEDIDLCWRARLLGWEILYVPTAVAYHVRGWGGARLPARDRIPLEARLHSWKNHYLLILKNDRLPDLLRSFPALAGWEVLRQGYAILRDPALFRAYGALLRLLPRALRQRREIMRRRRIEPASMRRWFGRAG